MATGQAQGPVSWRLDMVETFVRDQGATNKQIDKTLTDLREAISALDNRIKVHDESRAFWSKIWLAIATAVALGLVGFLVKISYIVQSAKIP